MKRLYVCDKADDDCPYCERFNPHECGGSYSPVRCYKRKDRHLVKCVRYRHPLEVAILKEIARQRKNRPFRFSCASHAIKTLWRVLKEGRKA